MVAMYLVTVESRTSKTELQTSKCKFKREGETTLICMFRDEVDRSGVNLEIWK